MVTIIFLLTAGLIVLSAMVTKLYAYIAIKKNIVDIPNARSMHKNPTPRGAGAAFIGLWLILLIVAWTMNFISSKEFWLFFPGVTFMGLLGFLDDLEPLPARFRLLMQIITALVLSLALTRWQLIPFIMLLIVWAVNLFNFMDGLDGLAGTQALFILIAEALFIYLQGQYGLALLLLALACCVTGFLIWNWPPANIFMGDCGSYGLALAMVIAAIYAHIVLEGIIVGGVFVFDATVTLLRRLWARQNVLQPHNYHAPQRLKLAGIANLDIIYGLISINCILFVLAYLAFIYPELRLYLLALSIMLLTGLYLYLEKRYPWHLTASN